MKRLVQKNRDARWTVKSKAKPARVDAKRIEIAIPMYGYQNSESVRVELSHFAAARLLHHPDGGELVVPQVPHRIPQDRAAGRALPQPRGMLMVKSTPAAPLCEPWAGGRPSPP